MGTKDSVQWLIVSSQKTLLKGQLVAIWLVTVCIFLVS